MGVPETISAVPKAPAPESREVAEVIKVQNEDELRLAQMGECFVNLRPRYSHGC